MATTKIMVVEDEQIVAKDIANSLKNMGYDVPAITSSGKEALRKATKTPPDLVLMDIKLNGELDGVEVAQQMRNLFNSPIIYLTAFLDEETLQRAKKTEPFGYVIKPFDERELHTSIEMALYKHAMEKKLKKSEHWLSTILHSIRDGVITTDEKGFVTFMNPIAESLTGWKQPEALRKPFKEVFRIVNEATGKQVKNPLKQVIHKSCVDNLLNQTALIAVEGTKIPIDYRGAPIKDDKGNVTGVVLLFRDITEKLKMEEELLKANKLDSIGILAGGIAHDFNNLLTAILGNIQLAKMSLNPEDEIFEILHRAENASYRAKDLTQQFLTFAEGGSPIKKTASISELIIETVYFALHGSNVKCKFAIQDQLSSVEIDEGQISRVVHNLIINAIQAMPKGGIIKVGAEDIFVRANEGLPLKEGKYVKIYIEDKGMGIPKEHLQKIFDPYFTTKQMTNQKGSGLGLTTAYSILKNHDGLITVDSKLGTGATFYIYLPASAKPAKPTIPSIVKVLSGKRKKGKILFMDDEEILRDVAFNILSKIGYDVTTTVDGVKAIELYKKAKSSNQPFDAVIMDLTIPGGMGGKEALQKLLQIDPQVKVVVSSGYSNDPIMSSFNDYGCSAVIAKPYKIEELNKILRKVISHK